jgi:hypothetical protein
MHLVRQQFVQASGPPAGRTSGLHGPRIGRLDGLLAKARTRAIFIGSYTWAGKKGTVVLAPAYPGGGEQGDHLIFRWRQSRVGYALGLHSWEPLSHAFATLRAMVRSI